MFSTGINPYASSVVNRTIRLISWKYVETQFLRSLRPNPAPLGVGGCPRKLVEIFEIWENLVEMDLILAQEWEMLVFRARRAPKNYVFAGDWNSRCSQKHFFRRTSIVCKMEMRMKSQPD